MRNTIAIQSLFNRFTIAVQSLYNRDSIAIHFWQPWLQASSLGRPAAWNKTQQSLTFLSLLCHQHLPFSLSHYLTFIYPPTLLSNNRGAFSNMRCYDFCTSLTSPCPSPALFSISISIFIFSLKTAPHQSLTPTQQILIVCFIAYFPFPQPVPTCLLEPAFTLLIHWQEEKRQSFTETVSK